MKWDWGRPCRSDGWGMFRYLAEVLILSWESLCAQKYIFILIIDLLTDTHNLLIQGDHFDMDTPATRTGWEVRCAEGGGRHSSKRSLVSDLPLDSIQLGSDEICCPPAVSSFQSSLVLQWVKEVSKWLGAERLVAAALLQNHEAPGILIDFKSRISGNYQRSGLLVCSYETVRRYSEELRGSCDLLVCDEAHRSVSALTIERDRQTILDP
jgi:hypothetical protein